jgi:hypothetical protein
MPKYYFKLLASGDRQIARSKRFLDNIQSQETTSKRNYTNVPSNATVKEERIRCGKSCLMCPHGPYYYAYWKEDDGKLKKKYIGTKYEETWEKTREKEK